MYSISFINDRCEKHEITELGFCQVVTCASVAEDCGYNWVVKRGKKIVSLCWKTLRRISKRRIAKQIENATR